MLGLSKGMGMVGMKKFMGTNQEEYAIQIEPTEGNLGYSGFRKKKKSLKYMAKSQVVLSLE